MRIPERPKTMTGEAARLVLLLVPTLLLSLAVEARAISITYVAADLPDLVAGEDLWRYDYLVSDHTFGVDEGFAIYFDPALYADLEDPPPAVNAEWDVLVFQPDSLLPSDGAYDALALIAGASLTDAFSLTFRWLGGTSTTPGSQPFELYSLDAAGELTVLDDGRTASDAAPVPEPATLVLLGSGLAMTALRRRRCR